MTIVVANAVHILVSMIHAMRSGLEKREALIESLRINMQPVVLSTITSIVLIAGFSVLILSSFKINADLDMITALTIGIAIVVDFILLPSLLIQFDTQEYSVAENLIQHDHKPTTQKLAWRRKVYRGLFTVHDE